MFLSDLVKKVVDQRARVARGLRSVGSAGSMATDAWEQEPLRPARRPRSDAFGPRVPVANHLAYRVKRGGDSLLVALYEGAQKVGVILARNVQPEARREMWTLPGPDSRGRGQCAMNLKSLGMAKVGGDLWMVENVEVLAGETGRGLGLLLYECAMAEIFGDAGVFFFVPSLCTGWIATSAMARRVWARLALDYLSSGLCLRVDERPDLAARADRVRRVPRGSAALLPARVPTSKCALPVLRLLLLEKTDTIPKTKAEIVSALGWFGVRDVDPGHLQRLQRKVRNAS